MNKLLLTTGLFLFLNFVISVGCASKTDAEKNKSTDSSIVKGSPATNEKVVIAPPKQIDTAVYNAKLKDLANGDTTGLWPQKFAYPLPGAILPGNRIIAFYGNLYSKRMGILGGVT